MNIYLKYFLIFIVLFFFSTCKKEEQITIQFTTDIDTNYNITVNGRKTLINNFKLYLSNIKLISSNNDTILLKDVFLYDVKQKNTIIFDNQKKYLFKQIVFGVGLDSVQNNLLPNNFEGTHPLSLEQGMYWSMLKYRFLSTEGALDSSILKNQIPNFPFSLHLGRNEIYQNKTLKLITPLQNGNINVKINFHNMFDDGNILLDSKNYFSNHSELEDMEDAKLLFKNLTKGIIID